MTVVLDFTAPRGAVIPACVSAYASKIKSIGGVIVSTSRTSEGFEVAWRPAGAPDDFEPMITCFAGPVIESPIDTGLADLEAEAIADPAAEMDVLPDVEALLFGSVATMDPAMAVLTDGYFRIADEPLHVPGAPVLALASRARPFRSVAAALSAMAASVVLLDAADGVIDGAFRIGAAAVSHLV